MFDAADEVVPECTSQFVYQIMRVCVCVAYVNTSDIPVKNLEVLLNNVIKVHY